jgi:hypothetical protein
MTPTKTSNLSFLIYSLFIFLFVYTALSKWQHFNSFRAVLSKSPIIGNMSEVVAWILPAAELIVALMLLLQKTRRLGLYSSFLLMILFTGYIGYMILFTPHLPCSCGGVLKYMSWGEHLIFNIVFTAVALFGIVIDSKGPILAKQAKHSYPTGYKFG